MFIETYHVSYSPKNRYWTGLLLFFHVIVYIVSAANVSGDQKIILLVTGSATIAILLTNKLVGMFEPVYKQRPIEILEIICHVTLSVLCLATSFSLDNNRTRATITNISMCVIFVLLLGILFCWLEQWIHCKNMMIVLKGYLSSSICVHN